MWDIPSWIGMDAWVASVCYNTVEAAKHNLEPPATWKDLLKPMYKGHLIMPNPNSSGTGFLDVSSWLQMFGKQGGWDYMDRLHKNIARYTHSGSKPLNWQLPVKFRLVFRLLSAVLNLKPKVLQSIALYRLKAVAGIWKRQQSSLELTSWQRLKPW